MAKKGKKHFHAKETELQQSSSTAFEFGGIERVDTTNPAACADVEFDEGEQFYTPPIEPDALSKLLTANSYHGAIVEARTRMLSKDYVETLGLPFFDMMNLCKDLVTFGNGYLQVFRNAFGTPVKLGHVLSQYTRKGKADRFCRLNDDDSRTWYRPGEIYQIKLYDTRQNIYGLPDYLSGIESALLSQDATQFRRRYYKNGMHMGFILYMTDPYLTPEAEDALEDALKKSRGVGNFSSMLINIPGGQEKGVQLIPVGNIGTKDEFEGIKKMSSQEVIVAHRYPAGLSGILPPEGSSLGNPLQYGEMYFENEVRPMHKLIAGINMHLPSTMHIKFEQPIRAQ
ncbi:phage portal protein [Shewanella sp. D64]|uniref:phage portal protein n=1 Tax=unclassified Shewanella TaxID=196818 RepID=UPI0022BA3B85|nr:MULTISPECIES: phage portal protein [unclassified Shewanella]MEC4728835.1 phage portal protein [Shewanella sp. D64]MEC4740709.1 phage portal protein [Shewanella sp. E94]WBJ95332.1 phage portal protein [Shewanella sp. MTB7]